MELDWEKLPVSVILACLDDWLCYQDLIYFDYVVSHDKRKIWLHTLQQCANVKQAAKNLVNEPEALWLANKLNFPLRIRLTEADSCSLVVGNPRSIRNRNGGNTEVASLRCAKEIHVNSTAQLDVDVFISILRELKDFCSFSVCSSGSSINFNHLEKSLHISASDEHIFKIASILIPTLRILDCPSLYSDEGLELQASKELRNLKLARANCSAAWFELFPNLSAFEASAICLEGVSETIFDQLREIKVNDLSYADSTLVLQPDFNADLLEMLLLRPAQFPIATLSVHDFIPSELIDLLTLADPSTLQTFKVNGEKAGNNELLKETIQRVIAMSTHLAEFHLSKVRVCYLHMVLPWLVNAPCCSTLKLLYWRSWKDATQMASFAIAQLLPRLQALESLCIGDASMSSAAVEDWYMPGDALLHLPNLKHLQLQLLTSPRHGGGVVLNLRLSWLPVLLRLNVVWNAITIHECPETASEKELLLQFLNNQCRGGAGQLELSANIRMERMWCWLSEQALSAGLHYVSVADCLDVAVMDRIYRHWKPAKVYTPFLVAEREHRRVTLMLYYTDARDRLKELRALMEVSGNYLSSIAELQIIASGALLLDEEKLLALQACVLPLLPSLSAVSLRWNSSYSREMLEFLHKHLSTEQHFRELTVYLTREASRDCDLLLLEMIQTRPSLRKVTIVGRPAKVFTACPRPRLKLDVKDK